MSKLNSKFFHIIIEQYDKLNDKQITTTNIQKVLEDLPSMKEYAFILHDKDKGKRPHYHINLMLENPHLGDTILYTLASDLLCNVKIITISSINPNSYFQRQRYLTHLDDVDKYQYDKAEVFTNSNHNYFLSCNNVNPYALNIDNIYDICSKAKSLSSVYAIIGLKDSNTYAKIIRDIYYEIHDKLKS